MAAATRLDAPLPRPRRMVRCLLCRGETPLAFAAKHQGVCALCLAENAAFAWRIVYDRDRGIGAIPRNLREAYRL